MKNLILGALLLLSTISFGQWTYKTIDNGFDEKFKKAYTATNNGGWLAMEEEIYVYKKQYRKLSEDWFVFNFQILKGEITIPPLIVINDSIFRTEPYYDEVNREFEQYMKGMK